MNTIKELKKYCEKHGYAKVAAELKFKTESTIRKWVEREAVPEWHKEKIDKILKLSR